MSSLTTVIGNSIEDRLKDVHTCLPGKVAAYYAADQLADVDIMVPVNRIKIPTLIKIPVVWPRTAQAIVHLPMKPGDFVVVLLTEEAIGTFRANQGVMAPTEDLRRHSLSGAYCIPGGFPDGKKLTITDPNKLTIHAPDGVLVEADLTFDGDLTVNGDLTVSGDIKAAGEITAKNGTPASVKLSTHTHPTGVGPSGPPTPGS